MSESSNSDEKMNISEVDSAVVPSCSSCHVLSNSFQFPPLKEITLSQIAPAELSVINTEPWHTEANEYTRKMRRKPRRESKFKPVLAQICEKEPELLSEKEWKYYSMFTNFKNHEVIYQDVGRCITHSNKNSSLCEAVFGNELEFVERLINLGISPNCYDNHKRTPLHIAVSKGYVEMVEMLLKLGADPNLKDGLGNSCLHLAACTNNVQIAMILIRGGASVHAVDIRGRSPIQLVQSKLRILQQCPDGYIKSKVKEITDMLLAYLAKKTEPQDSNGNTTLLTTFQSRLQFTETPEQISSELDNLGKILNQMGSLTIK